MGSFYGNYTNGGGGGTGGTTNYNELSNKPIKNLSGTTLSPIVLCNLLDGEYIIKGSYKIIESVDIKETSFLHVTISQDEYTGKKVCYYEKIENSKWFLYFIIFDENNEGYEIKTLYDEINNKNNILFINENELPPRGQINTLYITESNIYEWKEGKYIKFPSEQKSSLTWGSF